MEVEFEIPTEEVIRYLGGEVNRRVEHKIEELGHTAEGQINPDISYVHYPKEELGRIRSYKVRRAIKDCDQVVIYVATLGPEFDDYLHNLLSDNRYVDAYVFDAIGSAGAEALAGSFHEDLEEHFQGHDRGVTLSFSPGYCDWRLEDQALIFDEVDTDVELRDSYLMEPSKSVSGLFGITEETCDSVKDHNPCLSCNKINCRVRREMNGK